jgi:hypothetical protein
MSPDERLRLRKQPNKEEAGGVLSPATIDDDFHSVLAEPYEFHERHDSAATTSTTTGRSFRELHKKLAAHNSNAPVTMSDDEESETGGSNSDGRRTPLPPVEDEDEVENDSRPGSQSKQAMFYTPEASNSPRLSAVSEKFQGINQLEDLDHDDEFDESIEDETLSTAIHTVVSQA